MTNGALSLSIITPYYKTIRGIRRLARILEPQLNNGVEWIIVDDGCHDTRLDAIKAKIVHLPTNSGGASVPRNVGLDISRGEYLAFIDSDDYVSEDYIKEIIDKIDSNKNLNYFFLGWKSPHFEVIIEDQPPEWNCCVWNCVYKRTIIEDKRFNPHLIIGEDYDFNEKVRKGPYSSIKKVLYYYSDSKNSLSKQGDKCSRNGEI